MPYAVTRAYCPRILRNTMRMTNKLTVSDLKNDLNSQYRNVVANYLG